MEPRSFNILVVEDNSDDMCLLSTMLKKAEHNSEIKREFSLHQVKTIEEAENLDKETFDLMFLDLSLPDSDFNATINLIGEDAQKIPVIILTGFGDEKVALGTVAKGAQDYLIKGDFSQNRLVYAIEHAIQRHQTLLSFQHLALIDGLTGIYNRRGLEKLAKQQLQFAERQMYELLLFYIDMNNMKEINDQYGHSIGDEALIVTTEILKDSFRKSDIISRIGGDEFVVIAINSKNENTLTIKNRINKNIAKQNQYNPHSYQLSLSIGVAIYDPKIKPSTVQELITRADERMYLEKMSHRMNLDDSEIKPVCKRS